MCKYYQNKEYTIRISVDKWNEDKQTWKTER